MRLNFEGQVAVVTGAAQGIGAAIARRLAASGATVVGLDIDETGMAPLEQDGIGRHAADLSERLSASAAMKEVIARHGRVDILVTSAGGVRGQIGRPVEDISERAWHAIVRANTTAAMW